MNDFLSHSRISKVLIPSKYDTTALVLGYASPALPFHYSVKQIAIKFYNATRDILENSYLKTRYPVAADRHCF